MVWKFSKGWNKKNDWHLLRYDAAEVEAPPPLKYDSSIDERELSVEQWREALWEEVINWQPHPGAVRADPAPTSASTMEH